MAEESFGLFGYPTPEEVRQQIGRIDRQEDIAASGGSSRNLLSRGFGRMVGSGIGGLFGVKQMDPRVARAEKMQQVKQKVMSEAKSQGIDFGKDPEKYMNLTMKILADEGEHDLAFRVLEAKDQTIANRADAYYKTASADADITNASTKAQMAQYQIDDILSKISTREGTLKLQGMRNQIMAAANELRQGGNAKSAKEAEMISYAIPILDSLAKEKRLPTPQEKAILTYAASRTSPTINSAIGEDLSFNPESEIDPNAGVEPDGGIKDWNELP